MKRFVLFGVVGAFSMLVANCAGDGSSKGGSGGTKAGGSGSGGKGGSGGSAGSGGNAGSGAGGKAGSGGGAGSGGNAAGGATGSGGGQGSGGATCDIPSFQVFNRSDTDQAWDDNDFSDVRVTTGCPTTLDVTWPHEAGWENADPAEANQETTHITFDSWYSSNLTGKQLNLTIELTDDQRGPNATTGGYVVSLVSVGKYTSQVPAPVAGTGGATGSVDAAPGSGGSGGPDIDAGTAGEVGPSGTGGNQGTGGATTVTVTGYAEAESELGDRGILSKAGDKVTVTLPLPDKIGATCYDPATPVKVSIRIYNLSTGGLADTIVPGKCPEALGTLAGTGGAAGGGMGGASGGSDGGAPAIDGASTIDVPIGTPDTSGSASGFDYLTSKFTITQFAITDKGVAPPPPTTPTTP